MRLVDADALIDYLQIIPIDLGYREVEEIEEYVRSMPTIEERKRGEWIPSDTDGFVCSACRNGYRNQPTLMGKPMFEFCPVCGADMRGKDHEFD